MMKVEHAINRARSSIFKCAFDLCKILYKKNIFWRSTFLSNTRYFGRFAERNRDGCSVILLERKSIDDSRSLFAKGFELLGLREELEKHPLSCKFIRALVRLILNLLAERAVHSFFTPPPPPVSKFFHVFLPRFFLCPRAARRIDLATRTREKLWQPAERVAFASEILRNSVEVQVQVER